MSRTVARTLPPRKSGSELDAWLLDERELTVEERLLLAAYRDAADALRKSAAQTPEPVASNIEDGTSEPGPQPAQVRVQPGVPRLHALADLDAARLAALHGFLLAAGYLTAEVVGRADGLSYRITREGLRRLAGEPDEVEVAA